LGWFPSLISRKSALISHDFNLISTDFSTRCMRFLLLPTPRYSIYGSDHPLVMGLLIIRSHNNRRRCSTDYSRWSSPSASTDIHTHTSYTSSQCLAVAVHQEGTGSAPHSSWLCAPLLPLPCSHHACLWVGEAVHLPPHEQIPAVLARRQREPDLVMNFI